MSDSYIEHAFSFLYNQIVRFI